jgi:Ca2+-binding EF-hand superfamily protein
VVATIDKKKLLTRDKLKAAFSLFDKDDSGTISTKELKELLCDG